ncbi:Tic20 family membrane protein [Halalkaliarchaeum sp. AArc-CO]|uniref:DUF4870 domain-containing protein n=1 Tax=unclassified Halalkaliarchaeum TaxID=2678344 RepID=UPI00217EB1F7|nr:MULTISPECIES: hypothetical protein [unclassified Halalkaliarchaeum]MDR5674555.1 hypothetical protein [Halalkaliarchaeum sp. AArc-GB]UWG49470.1 Tic20 family membrane protein [Halalkaliarchaeum sp. AArc-CO]
MSSKQNTSNEQGEGTQDEHDSDIVEGAGETEAGSGTGLEPNVAGALSYLLGPITGILFYLVEDDDEFVRFHGAQSTIVFGGLFVLSIGMTVLLGVLAAIPVVGWIAGAVLGIASILLAPVAFVAWLFLMYKAYQGSEYAVPIAGTYARKYAPAK